VWSVVTGVALIYGNYFNAVHDSDARIFSDKQRKEVDGYINRIIAHGGGIQNINKDLIKAVADIDVMNGKKYDFNRLYDVVLNANLLTENLLGPSIVVKNKSASDINADLSTKYEKIVNNNLYALLKDQIINGGERFVNMGGPEN
jgi:hypothetical protein